MIPNESTNSGGKGLGGSICSEEETKLNWMRDTRIRLFMQMELLGSRDELDWSMKCDHCVVNNYPEEYWSSMPLPVPPKYHENLCKTVIDSQDNSSDSLPAAS